MPERSRRIADFLTSAGWDRAETQPLAGDASFRRYHRVRRDDARALLMDAPPDREDVRPFVRMARHLLGLGFSAPNILASDEASGLLLLEDFGDDTFTRLLSAGHEEAVLYALAIDVLVHLHRLQPQHALPAGLPTYDMPRLLEEALLLTDWYLPAIFGHSTHDGARRDYVAAWKEVLTPVLTAPATLVLRDFHVDNLMLLPQRDGIAACGLLDFQDAIAGPAAYDVMSLLEDARRDVSPSLRAEMLDRYSAGIDCADRQGFERAFTILAAQRHTKVIGIFTRLSRRDGKASYLAHIPRVWRLLERALAHDAMAPVARWFDRHLPSAARLAPPPTTATRA